MEHMNHPMYQWALAHSKPTLTPTEITAAFGQEGVQLFSQWVDQGIACVSKRKDFYLSERFGLLRARVSRVFRTNIIVKLIDQVGEYTISNDPGSGIIFGDELLITPMGNTRATIFRRYARTTRSIVGNLFVDRHYYVDADDLNYRQEVIHIAPSRLHGARPGDKVRVSLVDSKSEEMLEAQVVEILGDANDPWMAVLSLVVRSQVPTTFASDVESEVAQFETTVSESMTHNRKDWRTQWTVTIDGEDAKDFDDAVSIEVLDNGHYRVGVHIADVSSYVQPHTALDREARLRGTSIYYANKVIPMLPEELSNGLCSLVPHEDRLTLTCEMEMNDLGDIVHYEIYPSLIRSHARLTYTQVNRLFLKNKSIDPISDERLFLLKSIADALRTKREQRGALDLDVNESKAVFDENKEIRDIALRVRGPAEMLIEDLMICANETVAEHITYLNRPMIYRIHPEPKWSKLEQFSSIFAPLGYKIKGDVQGIHPFELQRLLKKSVGKPEHDVVAKVLLRSLSKAVYYPDNQGHFGLASSCYTHFTSPIRRYPDLIVHRLLWRYWDTRITTDEGLVEELIQISESSSNAERKAMELERDVDDVLHAWWMAHQTHVVFQGVISGFNGSGFFVELPNTVEGMVRFASLQDDYYEFDSSKLCAIGQATKRIIHLGDKVSVKAHRVSIRDGQIEFNVQSFLRENRAKLSRGMIK